jgi:hypothetical protein
MIRTRCPHCDKPLGVPDERAGLLVLCPGCKQKLRAPKIDTGPSRAEGITVKKPEEMAPPAARRRPKPVEEEPIDELEVIEGEPRPGRAAG